MTRSRIHTHTYTYAVMIVPQAVYDSVKAEYEKAGDYSHVFHEDREFGTVIDMNGIALAVKPQEEVTVNSDPKPRPFNHPRSSNIPCPECGYFLDQPYYAGDDHDWNCKNVKCLFSVPGMTTVTGRALIAFARTTGLDPVYVIEQLTKLDSEFWKHE